MIEYSYCKIFNEYFRGTKMKTKIKKFYIDGYRNLSNVSMDLHDITAIVALNSYGKSNLLKAIKLGIDFIKGNPDTKKSIFEHREAFPLLKVNSGQNYTFGINATMTDENDTPYNVDYTFSFRWDTNETEGTIVFEKLDISSPDISGGNFIIRNPNSHIYNYRASFKTRNKRNIIIKDSCVLAINILPNIVEGDTYTQILEELNNIRFMIEDHLDANESYNFDPVKYADKSVINIPAVIWNMKEQYSSYYELLINGFKQLFPNITDVICNEHAVHYINESSIPADSKLLFNDNIYTLSVTDSSLVQPISFSNLSDGTKRVFLTLTTAVNANINHLSAIALEEPENSIHPKLLQNYISILDILSGDCKLIFTSHSPHILEYIDPDDIIIGLPSETGQADFRYIINKKALINDSYKEKCSTGDFIFNTLSFENAADMLSKYVSKSVISKSDFNREE